jgi:NADH:ubiquinone oxidoreductase subunit 3 (subunit A)
MFIRVSAMTSLISTPIIVFILSLAAGAVLYAVGGRISPPSKGSKGKSSPYACGEDLPPIKTSLSVKLFNYAALFLVLDVISIMLALSMGVSTSAVPMVGMLAVTYIIIVLLSISLLLRGV